MYLYIVNYEFVKKKKSNQLDFPLCRYSKEVANKISYSIILSDTVGQVSNENRCIIRNNARDGGEGFGPYELFRSKHLYSHIKRYPCHVLIYEYILYIISTIINYGY